MLVGINSADLFSCKIYDKKDNVLTYFREKVEGRRADYGKMQIRIEPKAKKLFEKYRNLNKENQEIFKFYDEYADHRNFNKAINKGLKIVGENINKKLKLAGKKDDELIDENLQFYSARRSWASIARNIVKIDKYTVHEALNHTDRDMKVTDLYIDKDFSHIWNANKKVLALFNWDNLDSK
jgi:integrase